MKYTSVILIIICVTSILHSYNLWLTNKQLQEEIETRMYIEEAIVEDHVKLSKRLTEDEKLLILIGDAIIGGLGTPKLPPQKKGKPSPKIDIAYKRKSW